MTSARSRIQRPLGLVLRGVVWTALFAVLAASGAGLVDGSWHAPGSPARAELTWAGDSTLDRRLDVAATELRRIAADVEQLSVQAKTALSEVASLDPTRLNAALQAATRIAAAIDRATSDLQQALVGLPGDEPTAALEYSNPTLVRRAAILAALDAASSLSGQWSLVNATFNWNTLRENSTARAMFCAISMNLIFSTVMGTPA